MRPNTRRVAIPVFRADYFFVFATCLALAASFFLWLSTSAFACFCAACLSLAFGDLSPINRTLRSEAAHFNSDVCAESLGFQLRGLSPRSRLNKHKERFAQAPELF